MVVAVVELEARERDHRGMMSAREARVGPTSAHSKASDAIDHSHHPFALTATARPPNRSYAKVPSPHIISRRCTRRWNGQ